MRGNITLRMGRLSRRKVATCVVALAAMAVGIGIFVMPASADPRTLVVTLATGQKITVTVDVPPGTPVDQIKIPGVTTPIVSVQDVTPPPQPGPETTTAPQPPSASVEATPESPEAAPEQQGTQQQSPQQTTGKAKRKAKRQVESAKQGAQRSLGRRRWEGSTLHLCRRKSCRKQADRRAFDIAFASRNLPGETNMRQRLQSKLLVKQLRRPNEAVAVDSAKPREFGILQARYGSEYPHLLAMFQLGLESDHVPQGAKRIVLPELHDRMRPAPCPRIVQPNALHRAVAKRVDTA